MKLTKMLAGLIMTIMLCTSMGAAFAAERTKVRVDVQLGRDVSNGRINIHVHSGTENIPVLLTKEITSSLSAMRLETEVIPAPPRGDVIYVVGQLLDDQQVPVGYFPVSVISLDGRERPDLVDMSLQMLGTTGDAFVRSFPFSSSELSTAVSNYSFQTVLHATKLLFENKWVTSQEEWNRVTSDYIRLLPTQLLQDSAKVRTAFRYLKNYVDLADNPTFDVFYVELLNRMIGSGVGGMPIGEQNLSDLLRDEIKDIFSRRINSVWTRASNTIRSYEGVGQQQAGDCIDVSILILHSVNGAIRARAERVE